MPPICWVEVVVHAAQHDTSACAGITLERDVLERLADMTEAAGAWLVRSHELSLPGATCAHRVICGSAYYAVTSTQCLSA